MPNNRIPVVFTVLVSLAAIAGCANTIRGIGHDAANVVDATQNAAGRVVRSAED